MHFGTGTNLVCNTMWALSDFTADNGATHVVPNTQPLLLALCVLGYLFFGSLDAPTQWWATAR